jgi:hypothetical protein
LLNPRELCLAMRTVDNHRDTETERHEERWTKRQQRLEIPRERDKETRGKEERRESEIERHRSR